MLGSFMKGVPDTSCISNKWAVVVSSGSFGDYDVFVWNDSNPKIILERTSHQLDRAVFTTYVHAFKLQVGEIESFEKTSFSNMTFSLVFDGS